MLLRQCPRGICCGEFMAKLMGTMSPHVAPSVQATPAQVRSLQAPFFHFSIAKAKLLRSLSADLMTLAWCRQWSGVNGVSFFAPQIFAGINALGSGNKGSLIAAIIVNGVQLIATIITVFIVDKVGRRVLLVSGSALGFAAEIAVAIVFATSASSNAVNLPYGASIASIVLVSMAYSYHPALFAANVLHALQRLVTRAYTGGSMADCIGFVCMALGICNST